jgi:hypothetical protein
LAVIKLIDLADPDLVHVGVDLFVMMDMLQPMAFLHIRISEVGIVRE